MTLSATTGVAIGARFLAPHAGRVAGKLASKVLYRRRVVRKVRRRVDFEVQSKNLRSWLKTLTPEDLETPFENSGANLAARLNAHLSGQSMTWTSHEDHLSRALDLVEATFLGVLAIEDEGRYRELAEQWERARAGQVLDRLAELGGGYTGGMSRIDRARWLMRRSEGRRRDRMAPFGLEPALVADGLAILESRVPDAVPGKVQVLTAGFGAGKSETAEQWHRRGINGYEIDPDAPLPIWLHARQVGSTRLEEAIRAEIGNAASTTALHLVIDGLDEIEGVDAEGVLRDARVMVSGNPATAVLVTTRPNTVPSSDDNIELAALTDDEAGQLVDAVSGRRHTSWDWSEALRESIRSPFFALAAGTQFTDASKLTTQPELIAGLVERALRQGRAQGTVERREVFDLLVRCAVSLIDSGGHQHGMSFADRQRLRSTRLVIDDESNDVRFALPIFEQWFAAQALLDRSLELPSLLTGPQAFGRWRWSIAIALLSAERELTDTIVSAVVEFNPGAGAWVLARNSRTRWSVDDDEPISQQEAEQRLLLAFASWADAFGQLGSHLLPLNPPTESGTRGRVALGVRAGDGRHLAIGRRLAPVEEDSCQPLPARVHPLLQPEESEPGWWPMQTGAAPAGVTWPWRLVQERVARNTLGFLDGPQLVGPADGVWASERAWRAARIVMRNRDFRHIPLDADTVAARVSELLDVLRDDGLVVGNDDQFEVDRRRCTGRDLLQLEVLARETPDGQLRRPVPRPDRPEARTASIDGLYSRSGLVEFCAEMMGLAAQAYDEAAVTVLANFGWTLGHGAAGPFGVVGVTSHPESQPPGTLLHCGTMNYLTAPLPLLEELSAALPNPTVSTNGRAAFADADDLGDSWRDIEDAASTRIRSWVTASGVGSPFWTNLISSTILEVNHERPVSLMAAKWLFDDLKRLSLADGIQPRLSEY